MEYTSWAMPLADGFDVPPTFQNLDREFADTPGIYVPPAGCLLLGMFDGQPAGCVALKGHETGTCELKRLYVRPAFRGNDIGRLLVEEAISRARDLGYRRIILDSHISMTKAHDIYRAAGFQPTDPPDDFPDEIKHLVVFMRLAL